MVHSLIERNAPCTRSRGDNYQPIQKSNRGGISMISQVDCSEENWILLYLVEDDLWWFQHCQDVAIDGKLHRLDAINRDVTHQFQSCNSKDRNTMRIACIPKPRKLFQINLKVSFNLKTYIFSSEGC
eukprot:TRINITY_DN2348_c0_g1_i7.p1 TRINITY_DN2348_c0_g1~~TRINITY_DN2348_c0_g1_i7.p1  ORF type:complete len:138 (-),score=15.64 TRINITY_DN2348_c0_g1_i7:115-495(-)